MFFLVSAAGAIVFLTYTWDHLLVVVPDYDDYTSSLLDSWL